MMIQFCYRTLITALLLCASCAMPQHRLSGRTDIPLLLPGEMYASWKTDQATFDEYRHYMISKSTPDGKSITILASDHENITATSADKKVIIPEIGKVNYRLATVGGDEEMARFETEPFIRDDGHGGKVFYIVRVTTDDGDQEAMLKSVRWAAPGSSF